MNEDQAKAVFDQLDLGRMARAVFDKMKWAESFNDSYFMCQFLQLCDWAIEEMRNEDNPFPPFDINEPSGRNLPWYKGNFEIIPPDPLQWWEDSIFLCYSKQIIDAEL